MSRDAHVLSQLPPERPPLRRYGSYNSPAARRALSEVTGRGGMPQRSEPTSRVTFRIQYHVSFGQNLRVIGSHPALGGLRPPLHASHFTCAMNCGYKLTQ